ncbi:3-deoxy-D-manno-octulosonic acid transferase [Phaeobacter sp. CECT 5382]|uniref:3-deoxy-D-manno-octulosonic acid transferase n=1 Tax=Phaeobacter sp. CECT 5382 TaxID=1712645 RepID=UPI0006DBD099|nr:3-deoxy-D-manno-octulosonic acid transferase [Phaeobacter sp. CECT 5382]CUH86386.1 3-deoxy-D-manno-octulosonic acid transferase [Phaeobacter sp. CECT 5382]
MSHDAPGDASPTLLFHVYRTLTRLIAPFAYRKVAAKLAGQNVSRLRQRERLGYSSAPRPVLKGSSPLIWFHGASVGESLAAITLINRLAERLPQARFLLTSGTATSAAMAEKRIPACCQHQFAPLDAPGPVQRFLAHWRPDAGVFVESELWPVTLSAARTQGVKLALVNARLSERSIASWRKKEPTARYVLGLFDLVLTQNDQMAQSLLSLGAKPENVFPSGNLKAGAEALPVDATLEAEMRQTLGDRPLWIASSTHEGEEEAVLAAHHSLLKSHPDLCLLLAPRHPERGDEVAQLARAQGLSVAQRSKGAPVDDTVQIYLADTLGELGTWYALSPLVFLGGSFLPIGGHNPFEVAKAGAAVLTGPGYSNFAETFPPMIAAGGAIEVADAEALATTLDLWISQPDTLDQARRRASDFAQQQAGQLDQVIDRLISGLALESDA